MSNFRKVLEKIREISQSRTDQGDRFERLIKTFFRTDRYYKELFSEVWRWQEFPLRKNNQDIGIDLVAQERGTGKYWAIQCKFYDESTELTKEHLDSFISASGKKIFAARLVVTTASSISKNLEVEIEEQLIPIHFLTLRDLENSSIHWERWLENPSEELSYREKKTLRPHQEEAVAAVLKGLRSHERGKLIMACGTGKTFTALKIAEEIVAETVLFLVPSLALLSQTLSEWVNEASTPLFPIAVCSDTKVGEKTEEEDLKLSDLPFPATTDSHKILEILKSKSNQRVVVFSTYQSLDKVKEAQENGFPEFDLIICDEAHRTTGIWAENQFTKIHDSGYVRGKKRLYMTATPRLYSESAKQKAKEAEIEICSMDDVEIYGPEFYRLGFGEAVERGLLSDYRVLILAMDESYAANLLNRDFSELSAELKVNDVGKIIGCWNGLAKRIEGETNDLKPMQRAVAFCASIQNSKSFVKLFNKVTELSQAKNPTIVDLKCELEHIDGQENTLSRNQKLNWLRSEVPQQTCRILSNARCLTEGIDVPSLDAVIFVSNRSSQVDIVQAVGRVMRQAPDKEYGYIILPILIAGDQNAEEALNNNERYKVVWQVLQALRSHDDRFNAIVNQVEIAKAHPPQIQIIGIKESPSQQSHQGVLFDWPELEVWKEALYAKIVDKCGDRTYWQSWTQQIATVSEHHCARMKEAIKTYPTAKTEFKKFLDSLRETINDSISEDNALEMLSQHLVTKPIFDALFSESSFTQNNPVSKALDRMIQILSAYYLDEETRTLNEFYESIKKKISFVDNLEGKQTIITQLYENFFKLAFPKVSEKLGIVYTPIEVVNFIIHSVNEALKEEFNLDLNSENVHILDPFTGTGTFIVQLLVSGLIKAENLERKYSREIHANEILLLPYYIATANIETTYVSLTGAYQPFNGIVLTDTFQMYENKGTLNEIFFPENNERLRNQKNEKITVIIGNPPYSAGQKSENDGNKNLKYPVLDRRIAETYAAASSATLKKGVYDYYIRAIRWATDRIGEKGVIGFVTNGSFIESNNMDGLRKCLAEDFTSIYVFNLRGNARTSGELRRKERDNVFGEGTRTNVAITLLIKNPEKKDHQIYYHDIGDYLSREEKLQKIASFGNYTTIPWQQVTPNEQQDWINARNPEFEKFIPIGEKNNQSKCAVFNVFSLGIITSRDAWCYNFSEASLRQNMQCTIDFYNSEVERFKGFIQNKRLSQKEMQQAVESFINTDPTKISWSRALKNDVSKLLTHKFTDESVVVGLYRPYCKQ
ncbi:MAG: DEAD/DEAH box helicase family protein, partial [Candidatus Aenigmatarchaeota archaeon]